MINDASNKQITKADNKVVPVETPFYFPEYDVTIMAVSQAEALEKLKKIINNKK